MIARGTAGGKEPVGLFFAIVLLLCFLFLRFADPPLKPRFDEHTHIYIFVDVALYCGVTQVGIRNSLRSNYNKRNDSRRR